MTTYTPLARLPIMTPGDPAVRAVWGTVVNTMIPLLEQMALTNAVVNIAGLATYTLTVANNAADQARQAILPFTGALAVNCTVTLPSVARIGWATNNTTGGKNVILTTGSGTTLTIPPGMSFVYSCDGTNITSLSIGSSGVIQAPSGVLVNNATFYQGKDSGGTARNLLGVDAAGWTDVLCATSTGFRVLDNTGAIQLAALNAASGSWVTNVGVCGTGKSGSGNSYCSAGDATHPGFVQFTTAAGAAAGFIGFSDGGANITISAQGAFTGYSVSGNLSVSGTTTLTGAVHSPTNITLGGTNTSTDAILFLGSVGTIWHYNRSTNGVFENFLINNTTVGNISWDNALGTVYATTSDYRLKMVDGLADDAALDRLIIYKAAFKVQPDDWRPMGFAHEIQEHAPYAVTGTKDAMNEDGTIDPQCVDWSRLVPLLIRRCQTLTARVEALERRAG